MQETLDVGQRTKAEFKGYQSSVYGVACARTKQGMLQSVIRQGIWSMVDTTAN